MKLFCGRPVQLKFRAAGITVIRIKRMLSLLSAMEVANSV